MTSNAPSGDTDPRERLRAAAREQTLRHGMAVDIESILAAAGVGPGTADRYFGGAEYLLADVIRTLAEFDLDRYRSALAAGGTDARRRLTSLFERIFEVVAAPMYPGCRYTATELGFRDPDHPAVQATRAYRDALRQLLQDEVKGLGHSDPGRTTDQLVILIDGILVAAVTDPPDQLALSSWPLIRHVLDATPSAD